MPPLAQEPRHLLVVLNAPRRKALYNLVLQITAYMRTLLELHDSPESSPPPFPSRTSSATSSQLSPPSYSERDAPLFVPRSNSVAEADESPAPPQPPRRVPLSLALIRLRKAALLHFDSWRAEVLGKLKEVVVSPDDQKVIDARRKRAELLAKKKSSTPDEGEDLMSFGDEVASSRIKVAVVKGPITSLESFQHLYHPIPTRLTTIALDDRKEVLSGVMILLLAIGNYSAHSRAMICYLASALELSPRFLDSEETQIATTMVETAQKADAEKSNEMSAEAEAQKRKEQNQTSRFWKVGLASVAGAAIIGVTGGLAAPVVAGAIGGLMGSVGLGSLASFLGIFWMNGALVGTIFGAFGAKMTGEMIDQYAKEVEDFRFLPLKDEWGDEWKKDGPEVRRLRVTIGINGWLAEEGDVTKPWRALGDETEVFALRYELKALLSLGNSLRELVSSYAWNAIKVEILSRTVLATLWAALWPIHLLAMASNIDNPFSLARNRSEKAGKILADALINKVQGERPRRAFGLVDTVVLIGAPVPSNPGHWQMMRTVVSGKLFNVYSSNDYILAFLYRATSAQLGITGLQAISDDVDGVENIDLSAEVTGHLRYPELIPKILTRCGFSNINGGEGEIEKEDDIQLRNEEVELGNLIDIDEPPKKILGPSKHRLQEMENEKFDARVAEDHKARAVSSVAPTPLASPLPEANDPLTTSGSRSTLGAARGRAVNERLPPYSGLNTTAQEYHAGGDSSDEEGGITMINNDSDMDDMVEYMEPLRVDDELDRVAS
ncbi:uncharacterized protein BCR38DRAFT_449920 [Pseudomassariella vexata]|uniref:Uncharacterized protein n=1 Tax=Pseudomassariella vexata TaxID=1141098 RepID=A0A1Y2DD67_9PEZI|nr:uncharacterized protein BCR38DRAFT_449920 [Pseudomassariella vexata]ORY57210.1 hypothetical protein BCR38DRAFT_449920 [Pseudomassariella vexata]